MAAQISAREIKELSIDAVGALLRRVGQLSSIARPREKPETIFGSSQFQQTGLQFPVGQRIPREITRERARDARADLEYRANFIADIAWDENSDLIAGPLKAIREGIERGMQDLIPGWTAPQIDTVLADAAKESRQSHIDDFNGLDRRTRLNQLIPNFSEVDRLWEGRKRGFTFGDGRRVRPFIGGREISNSILRLEQGTRIREREAIRFGVDALRELHESVLIRRQQLREQVEQWYTKSLRLKEIRRFLYSESQSQMQMANLLYVKELGFNYARWTISPLHPRDDICDICASHLWLTDAEISEFLLLAQQRGINVSSFTFEGVIKMNNTENRVLIPELLDWSDQRIAQEILRYGKIGGRPDLARKAASRFPPHPFCRCLLNPILYFRDN